MEHKQTGRGPITHIRRHLDNSWVSSRLHLRLCTTLCRFLSREQEFEDTHSWVWGHCCSHCEVNGSQDAGQAPWQVCHANQPQLRNPNFPNSAPAQIRGPAYHHPQPNRKGGKAMRTQSHWSQSGLLPSSIVEQQNHPLQPTLQERKTVEDSRNP